MTSARLAALGLCIALAAATPLNAQPVETVIHISIDGLRPDAIITLGPWGAPNFYRMRMQGAFTDNARTDYDYTNTLPNHTSQLTSRPVLGQAGHQWTSNSTPAPAATLHTNMGSYVAGVFDVAHDNGLRTGLYAGKSKFVLFEQSWNSPAGAPDTTGPDNGTDKIDVYLNDSNSANLVDAFLTDTAGAHQDYTFIHMRELDSVGHASGWNLTLGSAYMVRAAMIDAQLGRIFDLVDNNPQYIGKTAIVLTADHGGTGLSHGTNTLVTNYSIPFYTWGPSSLAGADLYALNTATRLDPVTGRPDYSQPLQPIRNGEAGNLSLQLLGLGPIPGSAINGEQNLTVPEPATMSLISCVAMLMMTRRRKRS